MKINPQKNIYLLLPLTVFLICFLGLATSALAGWKIVQQNEDDNGKTEIYLDKGRVVSVADIGGRSRVILMDDQVTLVSDTAKRYWKGSQKEYPQKMCEFVRSAWEAAGYHPKAVIVPKISIKKLGMTKVAGYKAEGFRVMAGGGPFQELWVNRDSRLKDFDKAWKNNSMLNNPDSFGQECGLPLNRDAAVKNSPAYRKIYTDSFVLKSSNIYAGGPFVYNKPLSIEQTQVKGALYQIPADYTHLKSVADYMRPPTADTGSSRPSAEPTRRSAANVQHQETRYSLPVPAEKAPETSPTSWGKNNQNANNDSGSEPGASAWGAKQKSADQPEKVTDKIKKGVGGFLKSLF